MDNTGHFHPADDLRTAFNINFNLKLIEKKLQQLKPQLVKEKDYKLLSDYSVLLLKAGKTAEAIAILEQLAEHYPGEYQIAANLGTAYELNGNNEKALEFIKKDMELNPNDHEGSEWVHVKVLEAKLKLAGDTTYLSENTVLNLTEENKKDSLVRKHILIQVQERFPFCKGPDKIMASLLIDLGDCYANTASIEFAKVLYTIAKIYYGADKNVVDHKVDEMIRLRKKYSTKRPPAIDEEEGSYIKLGGITYKSMLDNNNISDYKINWENIESNSDTLLSYIDLPDKEPATEEMAADTTISISVETNTSKADDSGNWYYYLFGGILTLLLGLLLYKKVRK